MIKQQLPRPQQEQRPRLSKQRAPAPSQRHVSLAVDGPGGSGAAAAARRGLPPWMLAAAYGVTNFVAVVLMGAANRKLFITHKFQFGFALNALNTICVAVGMAAMAGARVFERKAVSWRRTAPIAAVCVGGIALFNLNLSINSLGASARQGALRTPRHGAGQSAPRACASPRTAARRRRLQWPLLPQPQQRARITPSPAKLAAAGFYQMSKLLITPVLVAIEWLAYSKPASARVLASVGVLLSGITLCTVTDTQVASNPLGMLVAAGAVVAMALNQVRPGAHCSGVPAARRVDGPGQPGGSAAIWVHPADATSPSRVPHAHTPAERRCGPAPSRRSSASTACSWCSRCLRCLPGYWRR